MVQWLRILAAIPEDLGWILSTHKVAYDYLYPQLQGILLTSVGNRHTHGDICSYRQNTIQIKK